MQKIQGFKGFDENLKCRDFQYEIGKEYKMKEKPVICDTGFHFCRYPLDMFRYYEPVNGNRFCEIEATGDVVHDEDDTKSCTNKIKICAELNFKKITDASINFIYEHIKKDNKKSAHKEKDRSVASNTGYNSVASNTGYSSVASNTGYSSVASNTGDRSVASNTGYSSVASNTGYSSVASNTGYRSVASNTGDRSVASNTGDRSVASNTGYSSVASNTGYRSVASNTGEFGIAASLGINGQAKGGLGTWLVLAEWEDTKGHGFYMDYVVKTVKTVRVDGKKVKADTLYQLINGKIIEIKGATK